MAKRSPLTDQHREHGARFSEEKGWLLPLDFGDPQHEYRAVRSAVGLLDFSHRSLLRFSGADRVSYLQGMLSNDVKALAPGQGMWAAILNVHGKILADTRAFCGRDDLLIDLWEPLKENILNHLNTYLVADEIEITDLTGHVGMISIQGPQAESLLGKILPPEQIPGKDLSHSVASVDHAGVRVIRCSHTGEPGFDLVAATEHLGALAIRLERAGKPFSVRWVGTEAQEILRIEAGIPRYGVDMDEENLLLETGLDRAVSFTKGCYLGQEVIERIRSRGHVNKKLAGMVLRGDRPSGRGDQIYSGEKAVGRVTSSILSPALRCPVALGYIHRDYLEPETRLTLHHKGGAIPAAVALLPFYKSSSPLESPPEAR